jgi:hypothetical protein
MSSLACEDADEIQKGLYRLRRLCFVKMGLTHTGCWCINARGNGSNIHCGQAMSPMPIDTLGRDLRSMQWVGDAK